MAEIIINVGLNPPDARGHQCLHLSDSQGHDVDDPELLVTEVNPGDTVKWVIVPGSGIASLEGIEQVGGTDLFEIHPDTQSDGSFLGRIKSVSPGAGVSENYNIWYKHEGSNVVIKEDPKLKMKR